MFVSAVPVFAANTSYMYAQGFMDADEFLGNYAVTGEIEAASGTYVGTGSKLNKDGKNYTVIVRGDLNGDGLIKSADYLKIKKYFSGSQLNESETRAADVNGDGAVKSTDFLKVKQFFSAKIFTLWSEEECIGERYMGFKIANHMTTRSLSEIKDMTDSIAEVGFNLVNYEINWATGETSKGVYNFEDHDKNLDYIVSKGMKICLVVSLFRSSAENDTILNSKDFMRDVTGNYVQNPTKGYCITPSSEDAMKASSDFVSAVLKHYNQRYGKNVIMVCPDISRYCELEYSISAETDYCDSAIEGYKEYLRNNFESIEAANKTLGTGYSSFDDIKAPTNNDTTNNGLFWFRYKTETLKNFIDSLVTATKSVRDSIKFCLQVGSINDGVAVKRGTLDISYLSSDVDVVWTDNGPSDNHSYQMDYLSGAVQKDFGNEADGKVMFDVFENGEELLFAQGNDSYSSGAKYVVCANWCDHIQDWSTDNPFEKYREVWTNLSTLWLGDEVPEMKLPANTKSSIIIDLYDIFCTREALYNAYYDGIANFIIYNDCFYETPETNAAPYKWPARFSSTQNMGGFRYRAVAKGTLMDMTFNGKMWELQNAKIGKGIMQMSQKIWPALEFKVPKDGTIRVTASFSVIKDGTSGIQTDIYVNDEKADVYDARLAADAQEYISEYDICWVDMANTDNTSNLVGILDVNKDDVIRFVISPRGTVVNEYIFANVEVTYKQY